METNEVSRKSVLSGLDKKLVSSLETYKEKILKNIDILEESLSNISFILEPEILELKAQITDKFQIKLQNIAQRNEHFFHTIEKDQSARSEAVQAQKDALIQKWRSLKH